MTACVKYFAIIGHVLRPSVIYVEHAYPGGRNSRLKRAPAIHTFFMRFAIDVVYLDAELKVLKIRRAMNPWRIDFPVARANAVLELPADASSGLSVGDLLCLS